MPSCYPTIEKMTVIGIVSEFRVVRSFRKNRSFVFQLFQQSVKSSLNVFRTFLSRYNSVTHSIRVTKLCNLANRMMTIILNREYGPKKINRKRIQRLMRIMGIQAIYPKRNLSIPGKGPEHRKYPYLLRNKQISKPNEVWYSDITYIRLEYGFVYLTAVMDWYTRKILSWERSTSMDNSFCVSALKRVMLTLAPFILRLNKISNYPCDSKTYQYNTD